MVSGTKQKQDYVETNANLQWKYEYKHSEKSIVRYRAHVYFPQEVAKALNLDPNDGNIPIRFMWKENIIPGEQEPDRFVTITRGKKQTKAKENIAKVIVDKLMKLLLEENDLFSDRTMFLNNMSGFREKFESIRDRRKMLENDLKGVFRGSLDVTKLVNTNFQMSFIDFSSTLIDYAKSLRSAIDNIKIIINSVDLIYEKGFLNEAEYQYKKEELKSHLTLLITTSQKTAEILAGNV